jgi:transposase-like protein
MGTRRRFSREFKVEPVELAVERGVTVALPLEIWVFI